MEEKKINSAEQEKKFREILSETKITASDNLKFRIMQQIETEKALSQKKTKDVFPILGNMITIFGVMYALIGIILFTTHYIYGENTIKPTIVYSGIMLITSVCSIFWMICVFDEKRRKKDL